MKKNRSINGFGIFIIVVLAAVMIWHVSSKSPDQSFFMCILYGIVGLGETFLLSGVIYIALFALFYLANMLCKNVYKEWEEDESHIDMFTKLSDEFFFVCFAAAYVLIIIFA